MRKLSLVALLLTVLSSAFASEKGDITVISDSSAVFRVYYSKPNVSKVKVSIYNERRTSRSERLIRVGILKSFSFVFIFY
ncbi:MAG: hypothetical protein AAFX57_19500, partial [Bacteroidota bacterium]